MRKIIIGFSRPRGFFKPFSWGIRLIERTAYSHVFIKMHSESLDVDLIYQASGTQVNFMGMEHFKNHAKILDEFEIDIDEDTYKKFMRWAVINAGAGYSLKQIFGILLIKIFRLKSNPFANGQCSWVCSELAGFVLKSFTKAALELSEIETMGPRKIYEICVACGTYLGLSDEA